MSTRAKSNKRRWERDYPFKVDLPERPAGYGSSLNEIHAWCRDNCSDWQCFGRRFYFKDQDEAARFRERWA